MYLSTKPPASRRERPVLGLWITGPVRPGWLATVAGRASRRQERRVKRPAPQLSSRKRDKSQHERKAAAEVVSGPVRIVRQPASVLGTCLSVSRARRLRPSELEMKGVFGLSSYHESKPNFALAHHGYKIIPCQRALDNWDTPPRDNFKGRLWNTRHSTLHRVILKALLLSQYFGRRAEDVATPMFTSSGEDVTRVHRCAVKIESRPCRIPTVFPLSFRIATSAWAD